MLNPLEKGTNCASFDSNRLILWFICVFRENLQILRTKIAFTKSWRKNKGQTEPRESEQKQKGRRTTVQGEARPCCKARKAARPAALPCCHRALAHGHTHGRACDRASTHGRPCSPRTAVHRRRLVINWFFRLFLGEFLWLGFVTRLTRVSLSHSQTPLGGIN